MDLTARLQFAGLLQLTVVVISPTNTYKCSPYNKLLYMRTYARFPVKSNSVKNNKEVAKLT